MNEIHTVSDRIREFVLGKFPLARKRGIKDRDALLETGVIDSMGVLEIVGFLEAEFLFQIADEELIPENFQNIERLAAFVNERRNNASKGGLARSVE